MTTVRLEHFQQAVTHIHRLLPKHRISKISNSVIGTAHIRTVLPLTESNLFKNSFLNRCFFVFCCIILCVFSYLFFSLLMCFNMFTSVCLLITSPAAAIVKYCNEYVCLSVCLSTRIFPEPHSRSLAKYFAWCLWLWLCPPRASLRYVMYFRYCG